MYLKVFRGHFVDICGYFGRIVQRASGYLEEYIYIMETTIVYWGYIRIMENKMETTTMGYIEIIYYSIGIRHAGWSEEIKPCSPKTWQGGWAGENSHLRRLLSHGSSPP